LSGANRNGQNLSGERETQDYTVRWADSLQTKSGQRETLTA